MIYAYSATVKKIRRINSQGKAKASTWHKETNKNASNALEKLSQYVGTQDITKYKGKSSWTISITLYNFTSIL